MAVWLEFCEFFKVSAASNKTNFLNELGELNFSVIEIKNVYRREEQKRVKDVFEKNKPQQARKALAGALKHTQTHSHETDETTTE
uniref:Uncharacterized protein n=1 Tax=Romanomermis culicivorax TaxID=13658 RepID=A0A915KAP1_ROMCU